MTPEVGQVYKANFGGQTFKIVGTIVFIKMNSSPTITAFQVVDEQGKHYVTTGANLTINYALEVPRTCGNCKHYSAAADRCLVPTPICLVAISRDSIAATTDATNCATWAPVT